RDREITITPAYASGVCGFDVSPRDLFDSFERLGFEVEGGDVNDPSVELTVRVSSFRAEVDRPIDLVEEFIRLHGADRLPEHELRVPALHRPNAALSEFNRRAQDYFTRLGAYECCHYTLVPRSDVELAADAATANALTLANPLTTEMDCLRASLLPGLLGALQRNQARSNPQARLGETGRVFASHRGQLWERAAVSIVLAETGERAWQPLTAPDFFQAKGLAEALLEMLDLPEAEATGEFDWNTDGMGPLWQPDHSARTGGTGWTVDVGLIHMDHQKAHDLPGFAWAVELVVDPSLLRSETPPTRFVPFANQPATHRDLALLVPQAQAAETVRREIARAAHAVTEGKFNVEDVELFDRYEDEKLGAEGKKSLAFAITFRAEDRTLTEKEINAAFDRIQSEVRDAGYAIRS
ncbi:MAG: hypothetical protein ACFB21_04060, partial [Opitutales bacterium]